MEENNDDNTFNFNIDKDEKEVAKVCFYTMDDKTLFEGLYTFNNCIGDVIKDFLLKQNNNNESFSYSFYIKNNDSQEYLIDENKLISFYLTNLQDTVGLMEAGMINNSYHTTTMSLHKFLKIYVKIKQKFDIPENIEEYIINNTELIGKPATNQLKYYIYNKTNNDLKIIYLSDEQIKRINIDYFSRKTVYCNAENNLFIYEGNDKNINNNFNNINDNDCFNIHCKFICINLKNKEVMLISSKFPQRILHSMIFIPEKYIFIVGGKSSKEVLIYTIKKENKRYEIYPNLLPYELLEPSLITVNNKYLYAFENSTFCMHILRTNFISLSPFEDIELQNFSSVKINQKFFGLVKQKNSIIFLGGKMLNPDQNLSKNIFEFNYYLNKLSQTQRKFISLDLNEKTFIPLGDDEYVQLTEYVNNNNDYKPKVIIFEGSLNKNSKINNFTSNGTLKSKCFASIHTKNVNIHLPDNLTSLVGSSSFGEMPVPLYNNYKNK